MEREGEKITGEFFFLLSFLPMKNDGGGDDTHFVWTVITLTRDGGDGVVLKFDSSA